MLFKKYWSKLQTNYLLKIRDSKFSTARKAKQIYQVEESKKYKQLNV